MAISWISRNQSDAVKKRKRDKKGQFARGGIAEPSVAANDDINALASVVPNHGAETKIEQEAVKKLGGPDHFKRVLEGGLMSPTDPIFNSEQKLMQLDKWRLDNGEALYPTSPEGSASIVERAYPTDLSPYDQDLLDAINAARRLERTGRYFAASDIADYVLKRRQVLFGDSLARCPVEDAVVAATLEQTRRLAFELS